MNYKTPLARSSTHLAAATPRQTLPGAEGPNASLFGELAEVPSGAAPDDDGAPGNLPISGVLLSRAGARFGRLRGPRKSADFWGVVEPRLCVFWAVTGSPEICRFLGCLQPAPLTMGAGVAFRPCLSRQRAHTARRRKMAPGICALGSTMLSRCRGMSLLSSKNCKRKSAGPPAAGGSRACYCAFPTFLQGGKAR